MLDLGQLPLKRLHISLLSINSNRRFGNRRSKRRLQRSRRQRFITILDIFVIIFNIFVIVLVVFCVRFQSTRLGRKSSLTLTQHKLGFYVFRRTCLDLFYQTFLLFQFRRLNYQKLCRKGYLCRFVGWVFDLFVDFSTSS